MSEKGKIVEHKFDIFDSSNESMKHNLTLKTDSNGHVCVYCLKHNDWILEFKDNAVKIERFSCLFDSVCMTEIKYTKTEDE